MTRIILASKSPRRKKLLEQIGLAFEVYPSDISENSTEKQPEFLVQELALQKARDISENCPDSLIVGADTIVVYNNQIFGKPENEIEATEFLLHLSDSDHIVLTGVAFVKTDKNGGIEAEHVFFEQTKVTFSALGKGEIDAYIQKGNPLDKAGAYGIQDDMGVLFVEKIDGDYYNVVGFPLNRFYRELKMFSPELALTIV